jgi:spermidine synthase
MLIASILFAFAASCTALVLELIAGRMMAPFVGVSLYTWTSIIGVVLAGVSLGNWLGGKLADRWPSQRALGGLFLLGGLTTLAALGSVSLLGDGALFRPLPYLARILVLSTLGFLGPSLVLAMITPLTIRLALPELGITGRVVGLIYASGTVGSLVGNFLTGFVLTAYLPVSTIVTAVGCVLLAVGAALLVGGRRAAAGQSAGAQFIAHRPRESAMNCTPAPRPASRFQVSGNPGLASAVVAVSSFCTMAIELAASRILAPAVGLSLYSWTGIIGAVLAGIAAGNYLGGQIADRCDRSERILGLSLFAGGLASLSILVTVGLLDASGLFGGLGLIERIVALTAAIFFLPVLLLGTISPQVIRLAVTDVRHAGRVSGKIYAWSTAGAIGGTFATGWWLISALGVHALVFGVGLTLVALAIGVGRFWRRPALLAAALAIGLGAGLALTSRDAIASTCTRETSYFCIRVHDTVRDGVAVKSLVLDHLIHSYVKPDDPSYLGYEHEYVQAELTRYELATTGVPRVLVIGGGGYTYPRWVERMLPEASVEVVEIDPGVTRVAYDELGLPRDTRIVSHNLDGRQFVDELAPRGHYALVVQDAVNDLSVPYHLMTREYNEQVRSTLAPGGAYLLTVIDLFKDGQLLRAAARTMMQTFPRVQLLAASRTWDSGGAAVWVIAGSDRGIDLDRMRELLRAQGSGQMRALMLAPERLQAYLDEGPQVILTDQYAPVDNLIAPLFTRRG